MSDSTVLETMASQKSVGSLAQSISLRGPSSLIHVGRPDKEEPHKSMKRVVRFRMENPNVALYILVWTPEDRDAMKPYEDEKVKVLYWESDEKLSAFLMDFLTEIAGAMIIGSRHYVCPDGHVTEGSYAAPIEKCGTCDMGVNAILQEAEKVKEFGELFLKVIKLTNFDTRSGDWLQTQVSPTANILRNMEWIEGCRHEPALNVKDREKGKTAIIVGAGPSLEEAMPHLERLSARDDHFVICVGRVFKMLAGQVKIAYTASCEMFDWDAAIFDGVRSAENTILAFASMCAPATVKAWPGKKTPMLDIETAKLLNRTDWIYGGNSVAHHMLNFAMQTLGAKEAILVGIDLAYTKEKTHADGSHHDKWPDAVKEAEKLYQDEMWVECTGKGDTFEPNCHRVPTFIAAGGMAVSRQVIVKSSPSYECFATLFGVLIAKHGKPVWNACPNGQKISGTTYLDLATYNP